MNLGISLVLEKRIGKINMPAKNEITDAKEAPYIP